DHRPHFDLLGKGYLFEERRGPRVNFTRMSGRNEPVSRVQIVLSALVDHSKVATFQGASVSDHSIDLVELERRGILRIVDTENEARAGLRPALDEPSRHTACA